MIYRMEEAYTAGFIAEKCVYIYIILFIIFRYIFLLTHLLISRHALIHSHITTAAVDFQWRTSQSHTLL